MDGLQPQCIIYENITYLLKYYRYGLVKKKHRTRFDFLCVGRYTDAVYRMMYLLCYGLSERSEIMFMPY